MEATKNRRTAVSDAGKIKNPYMLIRLRICLRVSRQKSVNATEMDILIAFPDDR